VSKYLTLAREGLVPSMDCPLDQGLLFANMDNDDQIFLYCISCEYKKYIGIKIYKNMESIIENVR
jgi:DNA-directed RNA polymerase subunit M/transcription elongation factor TFIIS